MQNPFLNFTVKILSVITIVFGIHILILKALNLPLFENKIILSYVLNTLLVIIIFAILYLLKNKFKNQLGFIFLIGSLLKLTVFFIFFYPAYTQDNNISRPEFFAFFTPYIVGLLLETYNLSKWLQKLDS
ncbi:DUF6168 family protein [Tenacibaculum sp. UWU-22]|uniref:DUF6168 family protein n=1 Tax=Tenacibaculum sp. UWU-22 TaxID=3234187 RepID=UPI0034DB3BCE